MTGDDPPKGDLVALPVRPLVSPAEAAQAWNLFLDLKRKLLDEHDYQMIAGKRFTKKSGFRKFSLVFNLSDRIIEQERTDREDGSFMWRIVVEVQAPNGRICSGVGICDSRERKFAHVEHDVYATCHTRAKNRGISDMVSGGIVSAEEIGEVPVKETDAGPGTAKQEEEIDIPNVETILDVDGIIDALESTGLDTDELEISIDLEGVAMVKPKKFLGDIWDRYNNALWKLGFSWVSAKKESHWKRE